MSSAAAKGKASVLILIFLDFFCNHDKLPAPALGSVVEPASFDPDLTSSLPLRSLLSFIKRVGNRRGTLERQKTIEEEEGDQL
jgi:hypothetical protein